ncbi:MAG: ribose-5-phosphate isomerase RpiA [Pisciglobus halotolerans]|nr:ribose-5-phosphate isomerase RpiA [Pisciglobus halotolerans]
MNAKKAVGEKAAEFIEEGMIVGLGTGSTAYYLVEALGEKVKKGLNIIGVTTSSKTKKQAESLGIPLKSVDEVDHIDITIDGADEISGEYQGIKGGGGALLYEKIVATYSETVIWIVDSSKMIKTLGTFPLPVEVIPYGSQQMMRLFKEKNYRPSFRKTENDELFVTDAGHYIIDLHLKAIEEPHALAEWLDHQVGVVEHGLFIDTVQTIIVGSNEGVEIHNVR